MKDILGQELGLSNIKEYVLLDIVEPLMILVESNNENYFVHVLQDRTVKTIDKKRAHIYEILVSKTTLNKVVEFLDAKVAFHELLMNTEVYTIGKIANKIYPKKQILNLDDIKDKLPVADFYLEPLIPNKIDLEEVKQEIMKTINAQ